MSFKEDMLTGRRNVQSTLYIIRGSFPTEIVLFKDAVGCSVICHNLRIEKKKSSRSHIFGRLYAINYNNEVCLFLGKV